MNEALLTKIVGPLAFDRRNSFVADMKGAAVVASTRAMRLGDGRKSAQGGSDQSKDRRPSRVPDQVLINDLAVNPIAHCLPAARGRGPDAIPVSFG
jgi:hypothetical protein